VITVPNALTLLRLIAVPFFIFASWRGMYVLAFILFVSAALTYLIDGFVARRFNQRSRIGAILDPAADKIMMVAGYLFYTLNGAVPFRIPVWLTFVIFIRDFMIMAFAWLLYTRAHVKRFPPSWAGKTSTLLQAITLGFVIGVSSFVPQLRPVAEILFRVALLITLYSSWDYMRRADHLLDRPGATA